jgi:hypothetical protein
MLSGRSVSDSIYDSDGIWSWTDVTSGQYTLKMNLYVPAGSAGGYIGIGDSQMDNNGNYSSMDYYIIGDTLLAAWDGSNYFAQGALVPNQWDAVVLMVDLDAGTSELMLNGVSIGTGTTGNLATNGFGGLDLWGTEVDITANPSSYNPGDYYFDDFEVLNMSTTEIDEISAMEINISPNPSNGEFAINFNDYEFDNASLTITNMLGAVVYSEQLSSVSNSTKNFNLDLNSGVYVVRVADNKNEMTSRVVIK